MVNRRYNGVRCIEVFSSTKKNDLEYVKFINQSYTAYHILFNNFTTSMHMNIYISLTCFLIGMVWGGGADALSPLHLNFALE